MDDETIFLNNSESNQIYRICIRHGCTPEQADAIAIDLGKAEARSFAGQLERTFKEKFIQWFGGAVVTILAGIGLWLAGVLKV